MFEGVSLNEAKRRKELAKAELAELELAEARRQDELQRGNVLPRDEWERFAREVVGIARDRIAGVPKAVAKLVDSDAVARRVMQEAEKIIKGALDGLARSLEEGPQD